MESTAKLQPGDEQREFLRGSTNWRIIGCVRREMEVRHAAQGVAHGRFRGLIPGQRSPHRGYSDGDRSELDKLLDAGGKTPL